MYTCIYTYIHIYIYIYGNVNVYVHLHIHTYQISLSLSGLNAGNADRVQRQVARELYDDRRPRRLSMKHRSAPKEKCPRCLSLRGRLGDTPPIRNKTFTGPCKAPEGTNT